MVRYFKAMRSNKLAILRGRRRNSFFLEQGVREHNCDSNDNGTVRDIKGGKVHPVPPMEVEKVDDVAVLQTIDEIAHRASENGRQRHRGEQLIVLKFDED